MISKALSNMFDQEINRLSDADCRSFFSRPPQHAALEDSLHVLLWMIRKWNNAPANLPKQVSLFVQSFYREAIFRSALQTLQPELDKLFGELDDYAYFVESFTQSPDIVHYFAHHTDNLDDFKSCLKHDYDKRPQKHKMNIIHFDQGMNEYLDRLNFAHTMMLQQWFSDTDDFLIENFDNTVEEYIEFMKKIHGKALGETGLPPSDPLYQTFDNIMTLFHNDVLGILELQGNVLQEDLGTFDSKYQTLRFELEKKIRNAFFEDVSIQPQQPSPLDKIYERRVMLSEWMAHLKKVATKSQKQPSVFLSLLVLNNVISPEMFTHWNGKMEKMNKPKATTALTEFWPHVYSSEPTIHKSKTCSKFI